MKKAPSDFRQVFGDNEDVDSCLAQIRDDFWDDITTIIPPDSAISSKECVLFAIYKLLEKNKSKRTNNDIYKRT